MGGDMKRPGRRGSVLALVGVAGIAAAGMTGMAMAASSASIAAKTGQLAFSKKSLTAKPGKVTINLNNPDRSIPHNISIRGRGVDKSSATVTGRRTRVTATLKRGSYTFYCSVGGHEEAGMRGTLRIR